MEIRAKTYDCENPEQDPMPRWIGYCGKSDKSSVELGPVEQLKQNPDSFFPEFTKKKWKRRTW